MRYSVVFCNVCGSEQVDRISLDLDRNSVLRCSECESLGVLQGFSTGRVHFRLGCREIVSEARLDAGVRMRPIDEARRSA